MGKVSRIDGHEAEMIKYLAREDVEHISTTGRPRYKKVKMKKQADKRNK